jgi:hypothetical protein
MASAPPDSPLPLVQRMAAYGCSSIVRLDEKLTSADQLDYLDLLPKRSNHIPLLSGVAEHQGTALLYLVDATTSDVRSDEVSLAAARRLLANRSDPAWLGVLRPGSLEIYPISFRQTEDSRPVKVIDEGSETAPLFFQSLVHGTFEENNRLHGADYVFNKIFDLLTRMTDEFVPTEGKRKLEALEVLSMAGRALFFRFLIDRDIVRESELQEICPAADNLKDAFSSADKAAQTSAWLDATFNGDFLPLIDESIAAEEREAREVEYLRFFRRTDRLVGKAVFKHLHAILHGWRATGETVQTELDWDDLDFAHIPVGVLSQVYESFSHRADPRTARDTSVHYTPRLIAGLMVDQAFAAIKQKTSAKVLDSSCGAGIFLVLAFRRLVREHWMGEQRPKTAVIQSILYNQLRGFDTSESALRLAALALYITAIELNGSPRPPQALKFPRNLRNTVLYRFGIGEDDTMPTFPLGSLGSEVPLDLDNTFDIVIGNPPWTRLRDNKEKHDDRVEQEGAKSPTDELNDAFTAIGHRVLLKRGLPDIAERYRNPDKNPDLPFLWRAMEWAKHGGVIALAMPARLFGRTSGRGFEAWRAVLQSIEVTGLINGADLRWSAVWDVKIPFCIFFARNNRPGPDHRFYYTAPVNEPELNGHSRFRIDYDASQALSVERAKQQPWIFKTLAFGTWFDVHLMEALSARNNQTLASRWAAWDKAGVKTGKGYDRSPGLTQKYVDFLADLPVFKPPVEGLLVPIKAKTYGELFSTNSEGHSGAHMPRQKELYQPPLVIVPQSPGRNPRGRRAYISDRPVAFSQSYYGYSCAGHPAAEALAGLIYLLPHSALFDYFCLMTSRRSGFDRQTFNKEEFDALPFPDISLLSATDKTSIRDLVRRLESDVTEPRIDLNKLIFRLYGLDPTDVQVAADTLFSAAPYRKAGKAALERTTGETREPFLNSLRQELEPYFEVCGEHVAVTPARFQPDQWREPWFFVSVGREGTPVPTNSALMRQAMEAANQRGCSRIIINAPGRRGLVIGLLNQRRWWTVTRARLCAQYIIRERLGSCGLPEHA